MPAEATPITVNLTVNITQFRALGGVFPVSATYTASSTSPNVKVIAGNIIIKSRERTIMVFQLPVPDYVFVGATFDAPEAGVDVGITEFPQISIDRTAMGNSLTITDVNNPANANKAYSYVLLVQSTSTGEIGLIDPMIVNDGGP
jgi:hypothetical protein